jgi:hypothetical protein
MQQWHKGPRPETATTWQQADRGPLRQTAATFWKQEGNERDLLEDLWAGDMEVSCRDFQRVAKNHKSDLMDGSATSEAKEKEAAHRVGAGNVGAPATS